MSYTKGPWKKDRTIDGFRSVSDGTKTICTIGEADIFPTIEDDAALIAAAPEMYEALTQARDFLRRLSGSQTNKAEDLIVNHLEDIEDCVSAALTKAKG